MYWHLSILSVCAAFLIFLIFHFMILLSSKKIPCSFSLPRCNLPCLSFIIHLCVSLIRLRKDNSFCFYNSFKTYKRYYKGESKVLQYFGNVRQVGSSGCFCSSRECDKPHSTVRCQACLIFFECNSLNLSMAWCTALKSILLGFLKLAWLLKFLQPKQYFLNNLVTALWSTAPSLFTQQMFLVASTAITNCFFV